MQAASAAPRVTGRDAPPQTQLHLSEARAGANASKKVWFRTMYFGAPSGAASLEAYLRCLPHVEATTAGSFPSFEAVEVVFDDQPGTGHFVELVNAYRKTKHLEGSCTSGKCRAAVVCTAHYQVNAVPNCRCASDLGGFRPSGVGLQASQTPACEDPAPNKELLTSGWLYDTLAKPLLGC
jgi:hypothetical protein